MDTSRHHTLFDPISYRHGTHVVGCGGSGSAIATGLIRLGVGHHRAPLILHDGDHYEPHNVANQFINERDATRRKPKPIALREGLLRINPSATIFTRQHFLPHKYVERGWFGGVVILAVDTMGSRKEIIERYLEHNSAVRLVFDVRMDAGACIIIAFNPNDPFAVRCYFEETWHTDEEAENWQGCSGHASIISSAFFTAGLLLTRFVAFANGVQIPHRTYFEYPSAQWPAGQLKVEWWKPSTE